jgi:protein-tyrosine phosphatase
MSAPARNAHDVGPELPPETRSVLFVCLGNICRSPLAKGVFIQLARERGLSDRFTVDSCGTGAWHVGSDADPRTLLVARKNKVPLTHRARQLAPLYDVKRFDVMLAMDDRNVQDMLQMGVPLAKVRLLREFDSGARLEAATRGPAALDVPDPYFGGAEGFDRMYTMIRAACGGLLDALMAHTHPT